jgi:hypothetical protein
MTESVTSGSVGGMASNGCLYPETALIHNQPVDLLRRSVAMERNLSGERATPPSARTGRRLAALQLVVIAGYYALLRLARHRPARTLEGVQPPLLG